MCKQGVYCQLFWYQALATLLLMVQREAVEPASPRPYQQLVRKLQQGVIAQVT